MIRHVTGRTISRGNETNFEAKNSLSFEKYLFTEKQEILKFMIPSVVAMQSGAKMGFRAKYLVFN